MKKADAWVVLRLDEDVVRLKDYVAVKGVYDTEDAAKSVTSALSDNSNYVIIRSRHYLEDNKSEIPTNNHLEKVQGLKLRQPDKHRGNYVLHERLRIIQDLWDQLPPLNRRRSILPLLSQLTELAVAKVTGSSIIDDPRLAADLKLPSGELVEVKTILLDADRKKSPNLQFPAEAEFDFLVVVIFDPNLNVETARMIPIEALKLYARPVTHIGGRPMINLRVTQPFLDYPGSKEINLANYSLNAG